MGTITTLWYTGCAVNTTRFIQWFLHLWLAHSAWKFDMLRTINITIKRFLFQKIYSQPSVYTPITSFFHTTIPTKGDKRRPYMDFQYVTENVQQWNRGERISSAQETASFNTVTFSYAVSFSSALGTHYKIRPLNAINCVRSNTWTETGRTLYRR